MQYFTPLLDLCYTVVPIGHVPNFTRDELRTESSLFHHLYGCFVCDGHSHFFHSFLYCSTMEGERHMRIVVKGCQNLINKDTEHLSELTDPIVAVFKDNVPNPVLVTPMIVNSCFPTWGEQSSFVDLFITEGTMLIFQVWHQFVDEKKGAFLGELRLAGDRMINTEGRIIDLLACRPKEPNQQVKVASETEGKTLGSIQIEYKPVPGEEPLDPLESTASLVLLGGLSVLEGRNLLKRDNGPDQLSDPYVTVAFRSKRRIVHRSETITCTLNPKWAADVNSAAVVQLRAPPGDAPSVFFEVYNANPKPERDSCLGASYVKLEDLEEGTQKLQLHPRPNEEDGVLKRMDGKLGWIVVDWKPVGELAERCKARTEARKLGLMSVADGVSKIAQWSPTELNDYLKRLRTGGPDTAAPTPGAAATNRAAISSDGPNAAADAPLPFHALSQFSPYYPHENSAMRNSLITTSVLPTKTIEPACGVAAAQGSAPSADRDERVATVEMTDVTPIRVMYGTNFYDTQLLLDEPLSAIQGELEDVFLVHKDVQLLFHIGELKDIRLSLRRNGCLLLKGDPHIKLTMKVAKGHQRNLVFVFPDKREVALAVNETETVHSVKDRLCDEFQQEPGLGELLDDPKEIRLLWRYNELNDRATIQYYNIPTNAKVNVARRPKFSFDQGKREEEAALVPHRDDRTQPYREERKSSSYRTTKDVRAYNDHVGGGVNKVAAKDAPGWSATKHGDEKRATSARSKSADVKRRISPTTRKNESSSRTTKKDAEQANNYNTASSRPRGYYELDRDGNAIDDHELGLLRRTVRELEQQVRQQTTTQSNAQRDLQDRRIAKLEQDLSESDNRYRDALQRIAELESSLARYQQLLQRATQLGLQ